MYYHKIWKEVIHRYTVPVIKEHLTGTVPVNKEHLTGTVPVNKEYLTGTVPMTKEHLTGTISPPHVLSQESHVKYP